LVYPALVVQFCCDFADAPDRGRLSEAVNQQIDVAHSVERGKYHRLGADRVGEVVHRFGQTITFHREQDHVIVFANLVRRRHFRMYCQISVWADNPDADVFDPLGVRGANQKGHVAPRLGKASSKVAADGAGPHNKNSHGFSLLFQQPPSQPESSCLIA
jgi:hypothetical protein